MACMWEKGVSYRVLAGKLEGNGPLESPRRRWKDTTDICLTQIGWEPVDWL